MTFGCLLLVFWLPFGLGGTPGFCVIRFCDCYSNVFKIDEMTFVENELEELECLKLSDFYHDVENKDKVVAILPFYIDRRNTLRFINDIHTDFCDILFDSINFS